MPFPPSLLLFSILKVYKIKYCFVHDLKIYIRNLTLSGQNAFEEPGFNNSALIFDCQIQNGNMTALESCFPGLV